MAKAGRMQSSRLTERTIVTDKKGRSPLWFRCVRNTEGRTMFHRTQFTVAIIAALVCSSGHALAKSVRTETARYSVVFVPSWNPSTHPLEYPVTHGKKGLLTPIIGATHNGKYRIFKPGTRPTPGLERLSERGKHDPLDSEIRAAIEAGTAGILIKADAGSEGLNHAPVSLDFEVSSKFSMVSLVGMIAPSPDWFYGASAVQLKSKGRWVPNKTVTVYAYDSGGDLGTTYMAEDVDAKRKQRTKLNESKHFVRRGKPVPVGVFVFKRLSTTKA